MRENQKASYKRIAFFFHSLKVLFWQILCLQTKTLHACSAKAENRRSVANRNFKKDKPKKDLLNCFFLVLVSLMTIPTGLNFNLVDELNTNYAKFIRTFPPKLHYVVRIRNIRRNGPWSGPAILYFWNNGNVKRLFVKFVWSIIKQY